MLKSKTKASLNGNGKRWLTRLAVTLNQLVLVILMPMKQNWPGDVTWWKGKGLRLKKWEVDVRWKGKRKERKYHRILIYVQTYMHALYRRQSINKWKTYWNLYRYIRCKPEPKIYQSTNGKFDESQFVSQSKWAIYIHLYVHCTHSTWMVSLFFLILFISKQSMAGKKSRRFWAKYMYI